MSVFIGYPSFMAYQMMKGKKGNNDDFPSIPGITARYSALGLTNEQMAANPVWVDKTGNGHDLQLKNFAWKGMSGVGGYTENYDSDRWYKVVSRIDTTWTYKSFNVKSIKDNKLAQLFYQSLSSDTGFRVLSCTIKVSGLTDGQGIEYVSNGTRPTVIMRIENDGIYHLPSFDFGAKNAYYGFRFLKLQESCNITIEQLPLYPGFILGDGVDDFAVTEKELNFEDTYTVYTAFIPFQEDPARNMLLCGKAYKKDFYVQYKDLKKLMYYSARTRAIVEFSNGFNLIACKRTPTQMVAKNLLTGKTIVADANSLVENPGLYYLWTTSSKMEYAKAAIAGQVICNGHFTTDEEDTKVLNWYKKEYPWLFFNQAWTVTGKSNEDTDRATIANITGNGNDLILSNLGFAEGSGYGLYAENYAGGRWVQSTDRADLTWTSYSVNITSVKVASTQLYYQSYPEQPSFIVPSYKIKVYGLKDGQTLSYRQATSEGQQLYKISEDGTYTLPSFPFKANGDWYGFTLDKVQESCDITIEQIPEYEGYLVTDGVDDKAVSKQFKFGENFTVILDFKFPVKKIAYCGFDLSSKIRIQNIQGSGVYVVLKGNKTLIPSNVVRAVTSEGKVYDENWNEYNIVPGNISSNYTMVNLGFDGSKQFAESATKLAGIYSSTLSKDDCIKAYNYLQTLKAK